METIYVSSLPFRADEGFIRNLFGPFGKVQAVDLHADWVTPTFEPYAHVKMEIDDVGPVVDALDGRKIGRTYIRVHRRTS